MILQNLTFGYILKNFLGNDPGKAITFAGTFLFLAATAVLFIRTVKTDEEIEVPIATAGH